MAKPTCETCHGTAKKQGGEIRHLAACPDNPEMYKPGNEAQSLTDDNRCEYEEVSGTGGKPTTKRCTLAVEHEGEHELADTSPGAPKRRLAEVDGKTAVVLSGNGAPAQGELVLESLEDIVDLIAIERDELTEQESVCDHENEKRKKIKDKIAALTDRLILIRDKQKHPDQLELASANTEDAPDY